MLLKYAKIAKDKDIELFSIGYRLTNMTEKSDWFDVINKVKDIYSGKLIYQDKLTAWEYMSNQKLQNTFIKKLDYIGIVLDFPEH